MIAFFFIRDYSHKYWFFSSEPAKLVQVKFSRPKEIWELAKRKLMLLPQPILRQEQALGKAFRLKGKTIRIHHSGLLAEKKIKHKFFFFLQKQRSKHVLFLIGETLLLPLSGLAAFLPGPNVFFGALALLMITHWQALRGINCLLRIKKEFTISPLFSDWERAVDSKKEEPFPEILNKIEKEYHLENPHKLLWK